ncbi:MAG: hypothetical protein MSB08_05670 [Subdoligranulum sp.]|nr:hypothetical protein [Subdoligranulum sp.]
MMRMILELSWLWKFLSVFAAIAFVLAACAGLLCRARQKPLGKKSAIVLILIAFVIAAVWLMQLARTPMPI